MNEKVQELMIAWVATMVKDWTRDDGQAWEKEPNKSSSRSSGLLFQARACHVRCFCHLVAHSLSYTWSAAAEVCAKLVMLKVLR